MTHQRARVACCMCMAAAGSQARLPAIALSGVGYLTVSNGPWSNGYMNDSPSALAVDSGGAIQLRDFLITDTLKNGDTFNHVIRH